MEVQITESLEIKQRKKETVKRVRTTVNATNRLIGFAKEVGDFTLQDAMENLGLKETCLRTHMSYINANGVKFGNVLFKRYPKTKIYRLIEVD